MRQLLLNSALATALIRGAGLVGVTVWALAWLFAAPASAHGDLVDGSPGPGDSVTPGVSMVQLEFKALDADRPALIAILGPDEKPIPVGQARIQQDAFVCAKSDALEPGVHTIEYSVSATDGHLLASRFSFEVSSTGTAPATTVCDASTLADPGQAQTLAEMTNSGLPGWLIPLLVGAAALSVAGVVLRIRHDRRRSDP